MVHWLPISISTNHHLGEVCRKKVGVGEGDGSGGWSLKWWNSREWVKNKSQCLFLVLFGHGNTFQSRRKSLREKVTLFKSGGVGRSIILSRLWYNWQDEYSRSR